MISLLGPKSSRPFHWRSDTPSGFLTKRGQWLFKQHLAADRRIRHRFPIFPINPTATGEMSLANTRLFVSF